MKENKFQSTFVAFKHRNYQLWFAGQSVSLFGTWMQMYAQQMLMYQLTKSPLYLGLIGFSMGLPIWIFTLYGGVIADRFPKRILLIITQSAMMILAFILAAFVYKNIIQPWHIIVLAFFLGIANALDAPARLALVPEMVEKEDLANAVALNTMMVHLAAVIGPMAAGIIYSKFGPGLCFLLNGFSFLAVILAILLMRLLKVQATQHTGSTLHFLREGLSYVYQHKIIFSLLLITASSTLFGISSATLFPLWADKVLQGSLVLSSKNGALRLNSMLQAARGLGSLLIGVYIASLGRFKFKGKLVTIGMISFPIFLFIFSLVRWIPLSLFICGLTGIFLIMTTSISISLCMTLSSDKFRGRVMSIYSLAFFGFMPFGSLFIGWLAQLKKIGAPGSIMICSLIFSLIAFFVLIKNPQIRSLE